MHSTETKAVETVYNTKNDWRLTYRQTKWQTDTNHEQNHKSKLYFGTFVSEYSDSLSIPVLSILAHSEHAWSIFTDLTSCRLHPSVLMSSNWGCDQLVNLQDWDNLSATECCPQCVRCSEVSLYLPIQVHPIYNSNVEDYCLMHRYTQSALRNPTWKWSFIL